LLQASLCVEAPAFTLLDQGKRERPAVLAEQQSGLTFAVALHDRALLIRGQEAGAIRCVGARTYRPTCVRNRSITADSKMATMILNSPPQFGQCSRSISKSD